MITVLVMRPLHDVHNLNAYSGNRAYLPACIQEQVCERSLNLRLKVIQIVVQTIFS
jgi:hypothetical protein